MQENNTTAQPIFTSVLLLSLVVNTSLFASVLLLIRLFFNKTFSKQKLVKSHMKNENITKITIKSNFVLTKIPKSCSHYNCQSICVNLELMLSSSIQSFSLLFCASILKYSIERFDSKNTSLDQYIVLPIVRTLALTSTSIGFVFYNFID